VAVRVVEDQHVRPDRIYACLRQTQAARRGGEVEDLRQRRRGVLAQSFVIINKDPAAVGEAWAVGLIDQPHLVLERRRHLPELAMLLGHGLWLGRHIRPLCSTRPAMIGPDERGRRERRRGESGPERVPMSLFSHQYPPLRVVKFDKLAVAMSGATLHGCNTFDRVGFVIATESL
jgi:hypothetical protein